MTTETSEPSFYGAHSNGDFRSSRIQRVRSCWRFSGITILARERMLSVEYYETTRHGSWLELTLRHWYST